MVISEHDVADRSLAWLLVDVAEEDSKDMVFFFLKNPKKEIKVRRVSIKEAGQEPWRLVFTHGP